MARQHDRKREPKTGVVAAFDPTGDRAVDVVVHGGGGRYRLSTGAAPAEAPRVGLAPWGRTLVRCRGVDHLPGEEMLAALRILGEGELPERVPAWRRGCGALPVEGHGHTAVLTAWMPGEGDPSAEPTTTYATAPAALALAVSLAEGCAFASDEKQGVLIVAASGPEGLLVRALRETPGVVGGDEHVGRRLREAAGAVGLHEDEVAAALGRSVSPWAGRRLGWSPDVGAALAARIDGWPSDPKEAAGVLLPACAAMLALADEPAVRELARLHGTEPATRATLVERADNWLISRRHVAIACGVLLLLAMFAPLLAAKARQAMLAGKVERAEQLRERYQADARLAAIYGQLNERVWPMTKMLAEVTAAAPVHVVVQSVRMDSTAQVDIEGFVQVAPAGPTLEGPPETLLTQFESALNSLGTLGAVTIVRREVTGDAVDFQITAQVRNPTSRGNVPMDYGQMPLAEVLYGEGASNTAAPILAAGGRTEGRVRPTGSSRTTEGQGARAERDGAVESGRGAASDRRPSGESGPASEGGVPSPLTDEQIAAMDRATAMREWSVRRSASRDTKNDAETRARLAEEAEKLNKHFREMGSGG